MDIVENKTVGDQVIEFNALSLFYSTVVGNNTLSSKEGPFGEAVKCLAFVRRRLNCRA